MLGSRFARLLPLRGPGTLLVPWAIPVPLVAWPLGGNSLAFPPGSLQMALGGAGLQNPNHVCRAGAGSASASP